MINAAEQIFKCGDGEFSSLIWLAHIHNGKPRPLIFMIHGCGWWKGFPDQWNGQQVQSPYPGTVQGFAHLIGKAHLEDLLGIALWPERSYQTDVTDDPFWKFRDSYGRLLRLELPGMNVHVTYP